jgi:hypothetical protein
LRGWLDTGWMLIALLAVLGVDLVVIMVLVGVLARRRWVSDQPGAFGGRSGSPAAGWSGRGRRFCSGMSWWRQMLRRALLARPSRVR